MPYRFNSWSGGDIVGSLLLIDPATISPTLFNTSNSIARKPTETPATKISELLEVSIYPNPFKDNVTISIRNKHDRIVLTDVSGRVLLEAENNGDQIVQFGEDLGQGFYIMKVISGNKVSTHRLIKK